MALVVCNKLLLRRATTGAAGTEAANQSQPLGNLNFLFSNWIGRRSPLLFTSFCFSFSFFFKFSYPGLLWFYWEINFPFSDLTERKVHFLFFFQFPFPFLVSSCAHFPFFVVTPDDIIQFSKTRKRTNLLSKCCCKKCISNPTKPLNVANFSNGCQQNELPH